MSLFPVTRSSGLSAGKLTPAVKVTPSCPSRPSIAAVVDGATGPQARQSSASSIALSPASGGSSELTVMTRGVLPLPKSKTMKSPSDAAPSASRRVQLPDEQPLS